MQFELLNRRNLIVSGLGAGLAGCINAPSLVADQNDQIGDAWDFEGLGPLNLDPTNLSKITVCLRPFRPSGPRLEVERIESRTLVHNYGHGGSGWSLAWGYAQGVNDALGRDRIAHVSVLGAGAIGLTSAIALAETGMRVTIYAREFPMESASSKATGVWSPSSRIGMNGAAAPDFTARWEALARRSYARHLKYLGRPGDPVEFTPHFYIRPKSPEPPLATQPEGADNFLHLARSLGSLAPPWSDRDVHPFPINGPVRGGMVMTFNIAEYTRQLTQDFIAMGGRIERADIRSKDDMMQLPGDAVVNCTGFGAKSLLGDKDLIPVRGQIAWMSAQTDRLYGAYHRNVTVLSRRDGLLIQETGGTDFYGMGVDDESADPDEFRAAHAKVAHLFAL
ncbi:MAG: FAD-dependent oxidoreductase [Erythrobacter sp.]|uniref:FAD-dependent oxidoreductase n=1 Tax=Erythrobacter sp. TaxID=1042 RepID=UPI0032978A60